MTGRRRVRQRRGRQRRGRPGVAGTMSRTLTTARITRIFLLLALVFAGGIAIRDQLQHHPENLPWTPLSLRQPIGMFTGTKLVALADTAPQCRALLTDAGVAFRPLPPLEAGRCSYADGITLMGGGAIASRFSPSRPGVACPVAAALLLWERDIVRRAAMRHFKQPVVTIEHFGTYNCRTIAGSPRLSEHATADAIDIAGFVLEDGTRVRVLGDWTGGTPAQAAFLREIRDGACDLFATVLSPDYNAAHADHFHLDQAVRGQFGGQVCR